MKLSRLTRYGVAAVAILMLLVPGLLVASTWTRINLLVALCAIVISILTAIWVPRLKWPMALISSLLIAVPPYPYWLFRDNEGNWYLHFFDGFTNSKYFRTEFGVRLRNFVGAVCRHFLGNTQQEGNRV